MMRMKRLQDVSVVFFTKRLYYGFIHFEGLYEGVRCKSLYSQQMGRWGLIFTVL